MAELGPDPLRPDADPELRVAADPPRRPADRRAADGPDRPVRGRQRLPGRGAVPQPDQPAPAGQQAEPAELAGIWADLIELMPEGVRDNRIDTVRPEHTPEAMGRPPRSDGHGGEVYVYRRAGMPCLVCGSKVRTELLAGRNLFWCGRCQRRG